MNKLNKVGQDISKASIGKIVKNVASSDAWREAKEKDPGLEFRMSYAEFKKRYFRTKKKI